LYDNELKERMDDDRLVAEILAVISDRGPATLEALLDNLSPFARPGQVARAFQGARAGGLIEAVPDRTRRGEPVYRLTNAGRARLVSVRGSREPRPVGIKLSIEAVLRVVEEFSEASLGLVAWELSLPEEEVAVMWEFALAEAFLQETRFDVIHQEQMARLTPRGVERLEVATEEAS
jgi:DNA-binding PadR family transcriptional regulator